MRLTASLFACLLAILPATNARAQAPAQAPAGARAHSLSGVWYVRSLGQDRMAVIRIDQVFPGSGVTNVSGLLELAPGQTCPLTGSVVDDLRAGFDDGPEARSFSISAFVSFRARCAGREYWIEALGLPSGEVLMNGRLTEFGADGRGFAPVAITR